MFGIGVGYRDYIASQQRRGMYAGDQFSERRSATLVEDGQSGRSLNFGLGLHDALYDYRITELGSIQLNRQHSLFFTIAYRRFMIDTTGPEVK